MLFLHVSSIIVALTGAVAHPLMFALEQKRSDGDVVALSRNGSRSILPDLLDAIAYVVAGIIGFGLVSMGDWPWGDAWIWISILLWVASTGLLHSDDPAEKAVAQGDSSAYARRWTRSARSSW
ncbi:MAG: hypothetical protein R2697_02150 [Ilumatobacteraceae bacterium]